MLRSKDRMSRRDFLKIIRPKKHGMPIIENEPEQGGSREGVKVVFEDEMTACEGCGIPLFPRSMVRRLESKVFTNGETPWPFNLCPSCRMKTQFISNLLPLVSFPCR